MIYLDNAATTCMYKDVVDAMQQYYMNIYSNPSEIYDFASKSRAAMNKSRKQIAELINADPTEIYFTSGGTESDNWALIGFAEANAAKGKHIITSSIEHHAILNTCHYLESRGFDISYINVDNNGLLDLNSLKKAIRKDTILISIMYANNEIGTIQNIQEIGKIAHDNNIIFHTDAVQAYGHIPINVKKENIDLLSASGHKCHGPKGIGFLYVKNGIVINPFHFGGKQERHMRPGTENIPAIAGFGVAAEIASNKNNYNINKIKKMRNHFIQRVLNEIEYVRINGAIDQRLPGNVNLSFAYIDGEAIQIQLDLHGICCSTGSACNAGNKIISHVIKSINVPDEYAYGTIRFTIEDDNTFTQINHTVDVLKYVINKLRTMSAAYNNITHTRYVP